MKHDITDDEIHKLVVELRKLRPVGEYSKHWTANRDRPLLEIQVSGSLTEDVINIYERHGLRLVGSWWTYDNGKHYNTYQFVRPEYLTKEIEQ